MKIQTLLLISALLLFSAFVQDSEGFCSTCPTPGKRRVRELELKVCIPGILKTKELH